MILTDPSVSTAVSFFTIAFFFDIRVVPSANTIATIAANPSGIAATASEIDVTNISINGLP